MAVSRLPHAALSLKQVMNATHDVVGTVLGPLYIGEN